MTSNNNIIYLLKDIVVGDVRDVLLTAIREA